MGKKDTDTSKAGNTDTTNLFFIVLTLKNYSSESKPLSLKEIKYYINTYYKEEPATISEATVRRIMNELTVEQEKLFQKPGENAKSEYDNENNLSFYIRRKMDGRTP